MVPEIISDIFVDMCIYMTFAKSDSIIPICCALDSLMNI